ncbi:MAG TPA: guanylate kinase [Steroidobacteraceae bacterium]|jgi:guanylate kinase
MGQLFVISAPSGAGKTTLVKALLQARPNLVVSVSHTTRTPRSQEVEGRDYYFVTAQRFEELVRADAFLEHASVFDNFYGTGRAQIEEKLAAGKDVLLEIDWQGARQVRQALPAARTIFILPPSRLVLEQRLRERRTDSAATIERRLADAAADMAHYKEFDHVVVNDNFERATAELGSILDGAGDDLKAVRPQLQPLIRSLIPR